MNRADVKELHFITYISNIPSIQSAGILSRNEMKRKGMRFKDISERGGSRAQGEQENPGHLQVFA